MAHDQRFESLLAEVTAQLRADASADAERVLPAVARFFHAERVYFRRVRLDRMGWDRGYCFTEHGTGMGVPRRDGRPTEGQSWLERQLFEGHVVRVDRLEALPAGLPATAVEELGRYQTCGEAALLEVPVRGIRGEVVASLGLRRSTATAAWSEEDVLRLGLVGELMVLLLDASEPGSAPELAALRRAAALSERMEQRLFAAMEVATIGFFDWDVTSDRVWYLSPFVGSSPYPRDTFEMDAGDWHRTTHPDDAPRARASVDAAIEGRRDQFDNTVRMRLVNYRDEWRWLRSRGKVLGRDARGRAQRIVGIYEDVTAAVHHAAQERERDLALEQATRSAALGTLATSLAHELNQPLAALTGFVQAAARLLAARDDQPEEVKDALRRSTELAEKASEIVRRMRRLVQHQSPELESVDLHRLMAGVLDLLRRDATAAGVELVEQPTDGPVHVLGDRIQVEQVLVNLVRNGIEAAATREGGPRQVTLEARAAPRRIELRVTDTGPGIRADVLARLFEPFVTTRPSGTGLGLTICRSIVEAHAGAIRVERTGPEGTCMLVSLPAAGREARADA